MKAILLSIKPQYADKILCGRKKYEYRKHLSKENVRLMYLYVTFPVMRVVASAEIVERLHSKPKDLWRQTKLMSGMRREEFFDYFAESEIACAYKLENIITFNPPKLLSEFGVESAPQSYRYIDVLDL